MKRYSATGYVWGGCWGGGECGYKAKPLFSESMKDLRAKAEAGIADGSLDGGMGYENLLGALLHVKVEDVKVISGKEYIHATHKELRVGKLSKTVIRLLREA